MRRKPNISFKIKFAEFLLVIYLLVGGVTLAFHSGGFVLNFKMIGFSIISSLDKGAGCEAAMAAAKLGSKTLLISMNLSLVAQMSCNPAMGGIAKGQIVREIDALGGMSGIVTDNTMIQFRMLNRSKGPAMWPG